MILSLTIGTIPHHTVIWLHLQCTTFGTDRAGIRDVNFALECNWLIAGLSNPILKSFQGPVPENRALDIAMQGVDVSKCMYHKKHAFCSRLPPIPTWMRLRLPKRLWYWNAISISPVIMLCARHREGQLGLLTHFIMWLLTKKVLSEGSIEWKPRVGIRTVGTGTMIPNSNTQW